MKFTGLYTISGGRDGRNTEILCIWFYSTEIRIRIQGRIRCNFPRRKKNIVDRRRGEIFLFQGYIPIYTSGVILPWFWVYSEYKQESIPVGCVLTTEVASTGSEMGPPPPPPDTLPLNALPLERIWGQRFNISQKEPDTRDPLPLSTDRHQWKLYLPATLFTVGNNCFIVRQIYGNESNSVCSFITFIKGQCSSSLE